MLKGDWSIGSQVKLDKVNMSTYSSSLSTHGLKKGDIAVVVQDYGDGQHIGVYGPNTKSHGGQPCYLPKKELTLIPALPVNSITTGDPPPIVCTLLEAGASCELTNQDQCTALHLAARNGQYAAARAMVMAQVTAVNPLQTS